MRDGRALQSGTSHFMGTNFAKVFNIQYAAESGELELCHTTSWGMSARMIGGVIMTHGDDKGLILPPLLLSGGDRPDRRRAGAAAGQGTGGPPA